MLFFRGVKYESYQNLLPLSELILRVTFLTIAFWKNIKVCRYSVSNH